MSERGSEFPELVELNVGGVFYTTYISTLTREKDSLLGQLFNGTSKSKIVKDSKGKYFIDRDGVLFRYVLDFLRNEKLTLPENSHEKERLHLTQQVQEIRFLFPTFLISYYCTANIK
jgi:ligand-binding sensor domain-containing protein